MDISDMIVKLEKMYSKLLSDNNIKLDISNIDSLGLNISERYNEFPFEFKLYYDPNDETEKEIEDAEIIKFVFDKDMVKYRCNVQGTMIKRNYVVLKNQTYSNMCEFQQRIRDIFPNLEKDVGELPGFIPEKGEKYMPIHILGAKTDKKNRNALNLEWMLKDALDENYNSYDYNDEYYADYLSNIKSKKFNYLIDFTKEMYQDVISLGDMHLWIMAIDYFPDNKIKYKVYLKLDGYNLSIKELVKKYFKEEDASLISEIVEGFLKSHDELKLYGLGICIDSNETKSINLYFISKRWCK